jgi:4-hydroxybenzoyl-CoA thioesterase
MSAARPHQAPVVPAPAADDPHLTFEDTKLIRFHHCDPAGIVFYPQYFVLFNELVEDWFTHGLGVSFAEQVTQHRMSVPMGRIECDFVGPSKIADQLLFSLNVVEIGSSSIKVRITVTCGASVRVRATLTLVQASLNTLRSVPITPDLREALGRYRPTDAPTAH